MQVETGTVKLKSLVRAEGLAMALDTSKGPFAVTPKDIRDHADAGLAGRGVFATKHHAKGTVIEISPVLILPLDDLQPAQYTILNHYT